MYYVYSLKCKDGYYVGRTEGLKDRFKRHSDGNVPATKDRAFINRHFVGKDNLSPQCVE